MIAPAAYAAPAAGSRAGTDAPAWVLVESLADAAPRWVLAEGTRPRRFTRLSRTRIAGSATVSRQLPALLERVITSGQRQVLAVSRPSGGGMRVVAVPVLGPDQTVCAVHVWSGPPQSAVPALPEVGVWAWVAADGGFVGTTCKLEHLLDSGADAATTRALPDLMRHFERIEDQPGLLGLFAETTAEPRLWSGTAVTAGVSSGRRRHVSIAACGSGRGRERTVRAVVHDIGASCPVPAPALATRLIQAVPIPPDHAVGLVDLRTGLVHEWISQGSPPLNRWLRDVPVVHPRDVAGLACVRKRLLSGDDTAHSQWRMRWGVADWFSVHARWSVLTRGEAPQAMLDVRLGVRHACQRNVPGEQSRLEAV